jgi:hypothetical protein
MTAAVVRGTEVGPARRWATTGVCRLRKGLSLRHNVCAHPP